MTQVIDDKAMDVLFREARSHNAWLDRPVADETLRRIYDLMKWGPTSANAMPARLVFLRTAKALFPHHPAMRDLFASNPDLVTTTARRNSSIQGAYFIIATRAVGLDCGPMSGFDNAKVDEEFYGDPSKLFPRGPRLAFEEACSLL